MYKNGSFISTDVAGNGIRFSVSDNLIECSRIGGGSVYAYYRITNENDIELVEKNYSYAGQYTHNETNISESEFNTLLSEKIIYHGCHQVMIISPLQIKHRI